MVKIRLSRGGANKRPFYHIVATDSRNKRDGRFLERLGFFNPIATGKENPLFINLERTRYWTSHGAQVSERVSKLLRQYEKSPTEATVTDVPATAPAPKAISAPSQVAPDQVAPDQVAPDQAAPSQVATDKIATDQAASGGDESNGVQSEEPDTAEAPEGAGTAESAAN